MLQYSVYYAAWRIAVGFVFFCDQRYTTEMEKTHLQQSQETSNVSSERLVFIYIKKSSPPPPKISPQYAPVLG
jgi:hypothetical protein